MGVGVASKMTIAGTAVEFSSESLARNEVLIDTAGIIGSRFHPSERVVQGQSSFGGSITLPGPNHTEITALLPYILGSGSVLTETLTDFTTEVERGAQKFSYANCKIGSATFSATVGGPLSLSLNIQALSETMTTATIATALSVSGGPYILSELTLTLGGTEYKTDTFQLTINHALEAKYFNSRTPTRLNETDCAVSWGLSVPWLSNSALYGLAVGGVAAVATFNNGTNTIEFSSSKLQVPRQSPVNQGRGEIMLPLQGIARKSGSTLPLVVTLT